MLKTPILALALALAASGAAAEADGSRRKAKAGAGRAAAAEPSSHKSLFATHLRARLKKIADAHAARLRFMSREQEAWQAFWDKVKGERTVFEERMARQGLALFDSLSSLDAKDHPEHVANYERLQSDVIRSFESRQRERLTAFFAEREAQLARAASEQERERADFAAEADVAWQEHKARLRGSSRKAPAPVEAAEPAVEEAPEAAPPERPVLERPANPMKRSKPRPLGEDKWH